MRTSFIFRLMTYFLIISLLPVLVLSIYFYTSVSSTLNDNLSQQAEQAIDRVVMNISACLDDYRHRSYTISTNEVIRNSLVDGKTAVSSEVYQQLYQAMRGTIYDASAHLISADGKTKFSTHEFPLHYDLRHYRNDVSIAATLAALQGPTILLTERYTNNRNDIIMMNLLRVINDDNNQLIGYSIIDLFSSSLAELCSEPIFSDVVLIDRSTLKASSMLHTNLHGDYSRFPALTEVASKTSSEGVRVSQNHVIAEKVIPGTQYAVAGIIEKPPYTLVLNNISLVSLLIAGLSVAASLLFAFFASKHVSKPVSNLVSAMKQVEKGDLDVQVLDSHDTNEIKALNEGFNKMIKKTRELLDLTREEEMQLREAERKALMAQINPHFLYNTLYTIKALASLHGEQQILNITTSLGKLLRNTISSKTDVLPLQESIDMVRDYLTIVQIRFPNKLRYHINMEKGCESIVTPKLIIQPFVENAVTHGLEPKLGDWYIRIDAYVVDEKLVICIRDNGIGYTEDIPDDAPSVQPHAEQVGNERAGEEQVRNEHVGIENVRHRLDLYYHEKAEIRITGKQNVGTVVRITLAKQ